MNADLATRVNPPPDDSSPFRIDQSSQSAKPDPTFALGPRLPYTDTWQALPPARNSPNSDYNRDSESDTRAHSPEEQLKRTIVLAISSLCAFLFVALPPGRPAQTPKRPHFTDVAARSQISHPSNNRSEEHTSE